LYAPWQSNWWTDLSRLDSQKIWEKKVLKWHKKIIDNSPRYSRLVLCHTRSRWALLSSLDRSVHQWNIRVHEYQLVFSLRRYNDCYNGVRWLCELSKAHTQHVLRYVNEWLMIKSRGIQLFVLIHDIISIFVIKRHLSTRQKNC
jgi:hypothetical protein